MRKLIVLGVLLAMTTGCGRGWFPHLFRGAPCNGLCSAPASVHNDCQNCVGYGAHEGQVSSGAEYVDGGYIGSGIPSTPTYENLPPRTALPNSGTVPGILNSGK